MEVDFWWSLNLENIYRWSSTPDGSHLSDQSHLPMVYIGFEYHVEDRITEWQICSYNFQVPDEKHCCDKSVCGEQTLCVTFVLVVNH